MSSQTTDQAPSSDPPPTTSPTTSSTTTTSPTTTPTTTPTTSPTTTSPTTTRPTTTSPTAAPSSSPETTTSPSPSPSATPDTTSSSPRPVQSPTTTFSSIVFQTFTSDSSTFTSAPSQVTALITSTNSQGAPVTVTQIGNNPLGTLNSGSGSGSDSFFSNKGAVAGVFVLVGLAITSILLWIFFALRRRRRARKLEQETAAAATTAAAFHRSPLEDDDDPESSMRERSNSMLGIGGTASSMRTRNSAYMEPGSYEGSDFNPYVNYSYPIRQEGYQPARTSSPPPSGTSSAGFDRGLTPGAHSATPSGASHEPLLASYYHNQDVNPSPATPPPGAALPVIPPRNPKRVSEKPPQISHPVGSPRSAASSVYSNDEKDDRLDPGARLQRDDSSINGDHVDHSRKLGVRNPDGASINSRDS